MPDRPLAIGAAGGSFATLFAGLVREFFSESGNIYTVGPSVAECVCEAFELDWLERASTRTFLAGLLVGGLLDIIWICRQRWRPFIISATSPPASNSKALYKVI